MKKLATLFLVSLFVLVPLDALAASGSDVLAIRGIEGRELRVRYEGPSLANLAIIDVKGSTVMDGIRVTKKRGTKTIKLPETIAAGTYTLIAYEKGTDTELDRTSFTLTYPKPTCRIHASDRVLKEGEMLRLRWTSENAESAMLFGSRKVETKGKERVSMYHAGNRGFALTVFGKGGIGSCSVKMRVTE